MTGTVAQRYSLYFSLRWWNSYFLSMIVSVVSKQFGRENYVLYKLMENAYINNFGAPLFAGDEDRESGEVLNQSPDLGVSSKH